MGYKIMWDALREINLKFMEMHESKVSPDMSKGLSYESFLYLMDEIEEQCGGNKQWNVIVDALEFGFACLGALTLVLVLMGRLAYVG